MPQQVPDTYPVVEDLRTPYNEAGLLSGTRIPSMKLFSYSFFPRQLVWDTAKLIFNTGVTAEAESQDTHISSPQLLGLLERLFSPFVLWPPGHRRAATPPTLQLGRRTAGSLACVQNRSDCTSLQAS